MRALISVVTIGLGMVGLLSGCADLNSYGVQGDTAAGVAAARQHYSPDNPAISFSGRTRSVSSDHHSYNRPLPTAVASSEPVPERFSVTTAPDGYHGSYAGGVGPVSSGYYSSLSDNNGGYISGTTSNSYVSSEYSSGGNTYSYSGGGNGYDNGAYNYNYVGDGFVVIIPPKNDQHPPRRDWDDDRDFRQREVHASGSVSASSSPRTIVPIWQRGDVKHLGGVSGAIRDNIRTNTPCVNGFVIQNNSTVVISRGTGRR